MDAGGAPVTGDPPYRDPRWAWPEYPAGTVVEIRIHGIGGEGPEGMTRDPHPVRVGGDDDVGFWRARNPEVPESPGHVREALSWGGSTSGRRRSALWVLLLPFALFNAAGRMGPLGSGRLRRALHGVVCRVLALSLTLSVVALTAGIVLDVLVLQCGAAVGCAEADLVGRWAIAPLRWFTDDAAAVVALAALVATAVPFLLRRVGRRRLGPPAAAARGRDMPAAPTGDVALDAPDVWRSTWPAWRLRASHTTAGYAWVVLVLGLVLPPLLPQAAWLGPVSVALATAALLVNVAAAGSPLVTGAGQRPSTAAVLLASRWVVLGWLGVLVGTGLAGQRGAADEAAVALPVALVAVIALSWSTREHVRDATPTSGSGAAARSGTARDLALLVAAGLVGLLLDVAGPTRVALSDALAAVTGDGGRFEPLLGGFPAAVYGPIWVLVAVQGVLLAALVVTSAGRGSDRPGRHPLPVTTVPGNLSAPVVALLSLLVVAAVGAGLHALVVDWLGSRVAAIGDPVPATITVTDARDAVGLAMPWWYVLTAQVTVGVLAVTATVAWAVWRWLLRRRPEDDVVAAALARSLQPVGATVHADADPADPVEEAVADVVCRTGRQWMLQALVRRAGAALGWALLVVGAGVTIVVVGGLVADDLTRELPGATAALAVTAAIPVLAVLLLRAAREDRAVRRQLAMLWDVLAFWPRTTHPFSPPSYGEAVVPALTARLNAIPPTSPIVLAAHSQGSVIALAAVLHPSLRPRSELHLVSFGSPIATLYEGFFPSVFGGADGAIARGTPGTAGAAGAGPLASWHDVFALTEPLATPLWAASDPGVTGGPGAGPQPGDALGWPVFLRLPWAACAVCGWRRDDVDDAVVEGDPTPPVTAAALDLTITDPDRIVSRAGEVDGRPLGHSSYHRSRELDLHLAHLAQTLRRR